MKPVKKKGNSNFDSKAKTTQLDKRPYEDLKNRKRKRERIKSVCVVSKMLIFVNIPLQLSRVIFIKLPRPRRYCEPGLSCYLRIEFVT